MRSITFISVPLDELPLWQADKRFLPAYLRTSDNTRRIHYYKKALRIAVNTRLTDTQREYLRLFYGEKLTKTEIGKRFGVGSSAVCKSLKSIENTLREYIELYMQIYDLLINENLNEDDEIGQIRGE